MKRFNSPEAVEAVAKAIGESRYGGPRVATELDYKSAKAAITAMLEQSKMTEGEALDAAHHHFHYGDLNILGANVRGYLQALRDLSLISDERAET